MSKYLIKSGVWYDRANETSHYAGNVIETETDLMANPATKHKFTRMPDGTPLGPFTMGSTDPLVPMDPTTTAVAKPIKTGWRDVKVDDPALGLGEPMINALAKHNPPLTTLGDVEDEYVKGEGLTHVKGIGGSSEEALLKTINTAKGI